MANKIVEEKIENIGQEATKNLNGDKILENELKFEIRSIINEDKIKTTNEEVDDLARIISKNLRLENSSEVKIAAKKIRIEVKNWCEKNVEQVTNFKKEEFKEKLVDETKKINPEIKPEELDKIKELGDLVAKTHVEESVIDGQKNDALEANKDLFSPGKLENSWTDLKGMVNFLQKSPEEVKDIKEKYDSLKQDLKNVKIPANLKEIRSFENIASSLKNVNTDQLFSKTKSYLGWADKVDKLTGGWLNKTVTNAGQKLAGKIGNQAVSEFAKNSLNVIAKQGFQEGFSTVLRGVFSGGVQASAATGTVAGGAAMVGGEVAAGGATLASGVAAAGGELAAATAGGVATGGAAVAGTGVATGTAASGAAIGGLGVGGAAAGGAAAGGAAAAVGGAATGGAAVAGGAGAVVAAPVVIIIVVVLLIIFLFVYVLMQGSLTSSLRPPKGAREVATGSGTVWNGTDCVNFQSNYPTTVNTKVTPEGLKLYIFETGGGKIMQLYDLACVDGGYLATVDDKYSNYSGNKLDSRVLGAFYKMYDAGQQAGLDPSELKLTSGYRSNQEEAETRDWWRGIIESGIRNGNYSGSSPAWNCEVYRDSSFDQMSLDQKIEKCLNQYTVLPGNSNHLTGRVADISVNTDAAYNWLKTNGATYGFVYNYPLERWHWEYNPTP